MGVREVSVNLFGAFSARMAEFGALVGGSLGHLEVLEERLDCFKVAKIRMRLVCFDTNEVTRVDCAAPME